MDLSTFGRGGRTAHRHHVFHIAVLAVVLWFVGTSCTTTVAIRFDEIPAAQYMPTVEAWTASVQAIKALEHAIHDADVRSKVRAALDRINTGFDPCAHNVYRCDNGTIMSVVVEDLQSGRVEWAAFPHSVRSIFISDSVLLQPLVLTDLPLSLLHFHATNTTWNSGELVVTPTRRPAFEASFPPPCRSLDCRFQLQTLQCESCQLAVANFSRAAKYFPTLDRLLLNANAQMLVDLTEVPPTVTELQLSHARPAQTTFSAIVKELPRQVAQVNFSYLAGVQADFEALQHAPVSLEVLDVSGIMVSAVVEGGAAGETVPSPLTHLCTGDFSPVEVYMSSCGMRGTLPDLRRCTRLAVLELSDNAISRVCEEQLPPSLSILHVNNNNLAQQLNVSLLPRQLTSLDVSSNLLNGPVDIAALPPHIAFVDVSNNSFSGPVNLTQLPESVKFVYLQYNNFTGEADLVDIPLGIRHIMIHHNNWDYRLPAF